MQCYDEQVPVGLLEIQQWFGPLISRPLNEDECIEAVSLRGCPIEEEALEYITSSPTLLSHERLELYNRQYWWRLVKNLKFAFPCLLRLFGEYAFQRTLAVPYLTKYPPQHWFIDGIGHLLPAWVKEDYHETDKELVVLAADVDWLCCSLFSAAEYPPLTEADLLERPIALQPYIGLREFNHDFMTFREHLFKEPITYWEEHPFPQCSKRRCFYAVMRNEIGDITWKELDEGEYRFLALIQEKGFLNDVCEALEGEEDVEQHLMTWIQHWFPHLTLKIIR